MIFPLPGKKTFSPGCIRNRVSLVKSLWKREAFIRGLPTIFYVESTSRCNLNCTMCARQFMTRPREDMPLVLFNKILGQLDSRKTELVVLHSDGEPLLNPHILDMIKNAKKKGLQLMTSTNATLLDKKTASGLIDSGLDLLTISIDGTTPEVYEKIRRGADFKAVVENIQNFLHLKGKRKPFTMLQMIMMQENEHQIDDFLKMWTPYRNVNTHCVLKPMTDLFNAHHEAIDDMTFCDRPWFSMVIQSSGNIVPCVDDLNGDKILGTVPEDNIYDIWNGESLISFRSRIAENRRQNDLCKNCNHTPPRKFNLFSATGLSCLDMSSIAKNIAIMGYRRPKQF